MKKYFAMVALALVLVACDGTAAVPVTSTKTPLVVPTSLSPSPASRVPSGKCRIRGVLPDPNRTPGIFSSAVTQSTINTTICVSGWTKTIRPPASYSDQLKTQQIAQYG